jgi:hypothetical protein
MISGALDPILSADKINIDIMFPQANAGDPRSIEEQNGGYKGMLHAGREARPTLVRTC